MIISSGGMGLYLQDCPGGGDEDDVTTYSFNITNIMNIKNITKAEFMRFQYSNIYETFMKSKESIMNSKNKEFKTLEKQSKLLLNKMSNSEFMIDKKSSNISLEKTKVLLNVSDSDSNDGDVLNPLGTSKNPGLSCEDIKSK
jgi:hypothetical protein